MLITGYKRAILIVSECRAMDWLLDDGRQIVGVDAIEVVASIYTPWRAAGSEEARLPLWYKRVLATSV